MARHDHQGPLVGIRALEFAGIGPGPHCGMMLADLGADVLRINRQGGNGWPNPVADRGRRHVVVDLKSADGKAFCLLAADGADVLIEGYRPGLMERLGLGPDILLKRNPALIYGRVTGWGQDGPLATTAGHDINYISLTGALAAMGKPHQSAALPLNLVGDFGGGSMLLMIGILAALVERQKSGQGQVIDAAIVDGAASLMSFFSGLTPSGLISVERDRNPLGGASHYYRCYTCKDGKEISVGAIEPQFYAELMDKINAPEKLRQGREDPENWPEYTAIMKRIFATKTRAEWRAILEGSDACFAPVLTLEEAVKHPHTQHRRGYFKRDGAYQLTPTPRFSRTPGAARPSEELRLASGLQPWETPI
ncbi:MAG: CoA transferase [Desulfobulbaceae bacterium]|jgi:alpha-methylacyl-CoA racemase|nr:CoA transferase [Desulfobulbaceae bacterium]